jgi:hypothetical protein
MTNLDALKANIADTHGIVLNEGQFLKALIDEDLDPQDEYSRSESIYIDRATVKIYEIILGAPNMTEGDVNYSITNKEYFEKLIDTILEKWGLPVRFGRGKPSVSGASPW